jgi:ketosteroid isomerase-like protein
MKSETLEHQVTVLGNTAISASRSHTTGSYKGKERDYEGMETMVLEKQNGEWKIKHIHWSH